MKPVQLPPETETEPTPEPSQETKSYRNHRGAANNPKFGHYIHPMLAKLSDAPFSDPGWVYEIKWDGYRAIAETNNKETRLYSRNGLSFKDDYPVVYQELAKINKDAIIDGEIVALDKDGKPQFQLLQQYDPNGDTSICYYLFDCLAINGKSIEDKPLLERKEILKKLLPENDIIRYCDHIKEQGKEFFALVQKQGLEGMIAKRVDSLYHEGSRSADWLKVKNVIMEEAVIAGYTAPRGGRKYFGALVLGLYKKEKFIYIGHTGTGFDDKTLRDVYNQLQPLVTKQSPFDVKVQVNAPVTWVKPVLVCHLKYTEITGEGHRRHPVFMGLRKDKEPEDVHEEVHASPLTGDNNKEDEKISFENKPSNMDTIKTIGGKKLSFTHLDKVFWPEEGYSKGDVIDYYNLIYPYIIKYLKDRPQSLFRSPNGIHEKGFFQKDAGQGAPSWVKSVPIYSDSSGKDVHYIICNDKQTLLYMANLGCIEINPWNSRIKSPDKPDYFIMDLDPSENNNYEQVIETANVIKEILDKAGAVSFPKTSGATGMHIYVPLGAKYTYEQARDFAHTIAIMANEQLPDFTSLERNLTKRGKDRIYIDFLQNNKGQTLACAYSLRPKPGATVSTPLEWDEVKPGVHPSNFTFKNIMARVEKKGDLFGGVLLKGIDMAKCLKRLS